MKQHRTGLCELVVIFSGSDDPLISCNAFILNSGLSSLHWASMICSRIFNYGKSLTDLSNQSKINHNLSTHLDDVERSSEDDRDKGDTDEEDEG